MKTSRLVTKFIVTTAIAAITLIPAVQAAELDTMFNEIGAYGNVTGPAVYKGQTSNLYTGGSLFMRTPLRNYQLMSMEAPYMRYGCGGIDIHAGSFSHINMNQLTAMFKNIGSNAIGYAFTLALGTLCPDCKNGIQWMNQLASEVNQLNINSCEAAKGLMPKNFKDSMTTIRADASASWGRVSNAFADHAESKNATKGNDLETKNQLVSARASDPRLAAVDPKGNIVWRALRNLPGLTDDQKTLLMSFIGTVIIRENQVTGEVKPEYIPPSEIHLDDVIGTPNQQLATIKGLGCLDSYTDCEVIDTNYTITLADSSIRYRVAAVVQDFIDNGTAPLPSSIDFLGSVALPLYKMVTVAKMTSNPKQLLADAIEVTSLELAGSYLDYVADTLDKALANHRIMSDAAQSEAIGYLFENIKSIRTEVTAKKSNVYEEVLNRNVLVEQVKAHERAMLAGIPARLGKAITALSAK